jgi:hypothetical protein
LCPAALGTYVRFAHSEKVGQASASFDSQIQTPLTSLSL